MSKRVLVVGAALLLGCGLTRPAIACQSTPLQTQAEAAEAAFSSLKYDDARAGYDCLLTAAGAAKAPHFGQIALAGEAMVDVAEGKHQAALKKLRRSFETALASGDKVVAAKSLYNFALVESRLQDSPPASFLWIDWLKGQKPEGHDAAAEAPLVDAAQQAFNFADQEGLADLSVRARVLAVNYGLATFSAARAQRILGSALQMAKANADEEGLLLIGDVAIGRFIASGDPAFKTLAYDALAGLDRPGVEPTVSARSVGILARLYAVDNQPAQALILTGKAALRVEGQDDVVAQLEFSMQKALLLERQRDFAAARAEYEHATDLVKAVTPAVRDQVDVERKAYVHALMVSVLNNRVELMLATEGGNPEVLEQARKILEMARLVDIQTYYADPCIQGAGTDNATGRQILPDHTAVLYPVVSDTGVTLIVATHDTIQAMPPVAMSRSRLKPLADDYAQKLHRPDSTDYLPDAQALYRILIQPAEGFLREHQVTTLVFAPDAELRGVPLAALHDGKQFVVERYAIGDVLSLSTLDDSSSSLSGPGNQALFIGVSVARQDFPALPDVPEELSQANAVVKGEQLLNEDATFDKVKAAVKQTRPNIIHIASHGHFSRLEEDNYVLVYDQTVSIKGLRDLIQSGSTVRRIDLLVLSACDTARGDDEALLGMAGAAYEAGARSVFGSLWKVSDAVTSELVPDFYREAVKPGTSKAEALQKAQKKLIGKPDTQHPYYWAGYVLVGDWK